MALSSAAIDALVIVVVLGVVVCGLYLYLIRRLRARKDQLTKELQTPELKQDRAYNRLAMARREADILERQGVDVTGARALIAQAQGAFDTRNFDRAYESAQSAHEALVTARRGGPLPSAAAATAAAGASDRPEPPLAPGAAGAAAGAPVAAAPPIPKNRSESQFQLRLLDEELARAKTQHPKDGATLAAAALRNQAQEAYDRADYTEAFRLSLRGRRQLGGDVGALAPSPAMAGAAPAAVGAGGALDDPEAMADRAATASRCPSCGYPVTSDDRFCRGCGRQRADLNCPVCNAPRTAADTFCGRCGARFG